MTLDLKRINTAIADRSKVFYWQTDRAVDPKEAGEIWADRHRYFTDAEIVERVNSILNDSKLASLIPLNPDAQTNLGNVSSVRCGTLADGKEVIIRCFPKGVRNGYFHAESAAAAKALQAGLPSYKTYAIHDFAGDDDFAFHVLEKLPGTAMKVWLTNNPADETVLVERAGAMMARLHQINVNGFGPFDNDRAKSGELRGLHATFVDAIRASLGFNLEVLQDSGIFTQAQAEAIDKLFDSSNPLLDTEQAVLVHNDFADWNLLSDGKDITGILDWDECVGGDPVSDIACWSTFFDPKRMEKFMVGYISVAGEPENFKDKFELLRLRYVISKMTLRLRRYSWDPSEDVKQRIETGKVHLAESLKYFKI